MEFVDRFFGIKRRKQEKLLHELGVNGEPREELVGPDMESVQAVEVENEVFLKILKEKQIKEVQSKLANQSDTHQYYELYLDIGGGVRLKTGVASIDYSHERTLFSDLYEMSFRYNPEESKDKWSVYEVGRP